MQLKNLTLLFDMFVGGWEFFFFFFFAEETGRVKNYLGECNLRVTRQVGECSEILVSNPAKQLEIFM